MNKTLIELKNEYERHTQLAGSIAVEYETLARKLLFGKELVLRRVTSLDNGKSCIGTLTNGLVISVGEYGPQAYLLERYEMLSIGYQNETLLYKEFEKFEKTGESSFTLSST